MKNLHSLLTAVAIALPCILRADPMGTAFTYQGKLTDGGVPANGSYDFNFKLFDGPVSVTQKGSTIIQSNIWVTNGLFSVKLDFGAQFNGQARWLEIWANTNTQPVSQLLPRQELTPTPYALFAGTAANVTNYAITTLQLALGAVTAQQIGALFPPADGEFLSFNGSDLVWVPSPSLTSWFISGNGGTSSSSNFLGTTDNQALVVRVNNSRALLIEPTSFAPNLIGGDPANRVDAGYYGSTIGGGGATGDANRIIAEYATIGGGTGNTNGSAYGTIGGGVHNKITNLVATVGGGEQNSVSANWATVGGGNGNHAGGQDGTISGGSGNWLSAGQSTVGGGIENSVFAPEATIAGGSQNWIDLVASQATIGGGALNTANGYDSTIAGGYYNSNFSAYGTIGGGAWNRVQSPYSATIAGGYQNLVLGQDATIGGGSYNSAGSDYSSIAGGQYNFIGTSIWEILGFGFQTNHSHAAVVSGGVNNTNVGFFSSLGGGQNNLIRGPVGNVESSYGVIGGGTGNKIDAINAGVVGGGRDNVVDGDYAVVPGGRSANAYNYGQWAFAAGAIDAAGDAQASTYVLRRKFSGSGDLYLNGDTGSTAVAVRSGSVWTLHFQISGVSVSGTNFGSYEVSGVIAKVGGLTTFRLMDGSGAVVGTARPIFETTGATTWQAAPYLNADGFLHVGVFATETVKWCARIDVAEVTR